LRSSIPSVAAVYTTLRWQSSRFRCRSVTSSQVHCTCLGRERAPARSLVSRNLHGPASLQRGLRKQASLAYTRRTAPAYSVTEHPQHTYIHHHTHAHTHIQVTCEIHAHAYTAIVCYDSLQLTSSMHTAKGKGHRAHGQKEIMHAYGPKSTPIAQGLVEDINAMHAYGIPLHP